LFKTKTFLKHVRFQRYKNNSEVEKQFLLQINDLHVETSIIPLKKRGVNLKA
jgi:hypothetical protein